MPKFDIRNMLNNSRAQDLLKQHLSDKAFNKFSEAQDSILKFGSDSKKGLKSALNHSNTLIRELLKGGLSKATLTELSDLGSKPLEERTAVDKTAEATPPSFFRNSGSITKIENCLQELGSRSRTSQMLSVLSKAKVYAKSLQPEDAAGNPTIMAIINMAQGKDTDAASYLVTQILNNPNAFGFNGLRSARCFCKRLVGTRGMRSRILGKRAGSFSEKSSNVKSNLNKYKAQSMQDRLPLPPSISSKDGIAKDSIGSANQEAISAPPPPPPPAISSGAPAGSPPPPPPPPGGLETPANTGSSGTTLADILANQKANLKSAGEAPASTQQPMNAADSFKKLHNLKNQLQDAKNSGASQEEIQRIEAELKAFQKKPTRASLFGKTVSPSDNAKQSLINKHRPTRKAGKAPEIRTKADLIKEGMGSRGEKTLTFDLKYNEMPSVPASVISQLTVDEVIKYFTPYHMASLTDDQKAAFSKEFLSSLVKKVEGTVKAEDIDKGYLLLFSLYSNILIKGVICSQARNNPFKNHSGPVTVLQTKLRGFELRENGKQHEMPATLPDTITVEDLDRYHGIEPKATSKTVIFGPSTKTGKSTSTPVISPSIVTNPTSTEGKATPESTTKPKAESTTPAGETITPEATSSGPRTPPPVPVVTPPKPTLSKPVDRDSLMKSLIGDRARAGLRNVKPEEKNDTSAPKTGHSVSSEDKPSTPKNSDEKASSTGFNTSIADKARAAGESRKATFEEKSSSSSEEEESSWDEEEDDSSDYSTSSSGSTTSTDSADSTKDEESKFFDDIGVSATALLNDFIDSDYKNKISESDKASAKSILNKFTTASDKLKSKLGIFVGRIQAALDKLLNLEASKASTPETTSTSSEKKTESGETSSSLASIQDRLHREIAKRDFFNEEQEEKFKGWLEAFDDGDLTEEEIIERISVEKIIRKKNQPDIKPVITKKMLQELITAYG